MFKATKTAFLAVLLMGVVLPAGLLAEGTSGGNSTSGPYSINSFTANGVVDLELSSPEESFTLEIDTDSPWCRFTSPVSGSWIKPSDVNRTIEPGDSAYPQEGETITFTISCKELIQDNPYEILSEVEKTVTVTLPEAAAPEVAADIKANGEDGPVILNEGESYTHSWTSENATACTITSPTGTSGVDLNSGSTSEITPDHAWYPSTSTPVVLTLHCFNSEDDATDTVEIKLKEKDVPPPGDSDVIADIKANGSDGPVTITEGDSYTHSWTSENATACTITSPTGTSGVDLNSASTTAITPDHPWYPAIGSPVTLSLHCFNSTKDATDTVEINLKKKDTPPSDPDVTADIKANGSDGPVEINNGDSYTHSWTSTGATSCTITSPTGTSGVDLNSASTTAITPGHPWYPTLSSSVTLSLHCFNATNQATDTVEIKLKKDGGGGGSSKKATIVATKVVCDKEEDLPNWSGTSVNITSNTASDFVAANSKCQIVSGWDFQWAPSTAKDLGGDFIGEAGSPWKTFSGSTTITIPSDKKVWVREVLTSDYIVFDGEEGNLPGSDVSAEMYCHNDVLNYDNYDFISGMENGKTYHCVAFNAKKDAGAPDVTADIKANGSDGPVEINNGDSYTHSWTSTGATSCTITSPTGTSGVDLNSASTTPIAPGHDWYPSVSSSVTLTIHCFNSENDATDSVEIKIKKGGGGGGDDDVTVDLVADPETINEGATSTLTWTSDNADSCSASWTTSTSTSGSQVVSPATTTSYSITCTGPDGSDTDTATVTVIPAAPDAVTVDLNADPETIDKGATSTLTWTSKNATICQAAWTSATSTSGSQDVAPESTTTYEIVCTGPNGSATSTATVTVKTPDEPNNPGGGGGGGGGGRRRGGSSSTPVEPGVCYYLKDYLRIDFDNDPVEMLKLQSFLNIFEGETLLLNGVFDQATLEAVNRFQVKYFDDVLEPWGHTGPTGYVYYTTQKKVNEIYCQRLFPLNEGQIQEIIAFRALLESLRNQGIDIDVPVVGVGGGEDEPSATTSVPVIPIVGSEDDENDNQGQNIGIAAAIFSLPDTLGDAAQCSYKCLIILVVLYILGVVLKDVLYKDVPENAKKRFLTKWITISVGIAIAIIVAYYLAWWCIILPLIIALIISVIWLLTYEKRGPKNPKGTPITSVIPPVINLPSSKEKKDSSKGFSGVSVDTSKNGAVK